MVHTGSDFKLIEGNNKKLRRINNYSKYLYGKPAHRALKNYDDKLNEYLTDLRLTDLEVVYGDPYHNGRPNTFLKERDFNAMYITDKSVAKNSSSLQGATIEDSPYSAYNPIFNMKDELVEGLDYNVLLYNNSVNNNNKKWKYGYVYNKGADGTRYRVDTYPPNDHGGDGELYDEEGHKINHPEDVLVIFGPTLYDDCGNIMFETSGEPYFDDKWYGKPGEDVPLYLEDGTKAFSVNKNIGNTDRIYKVPVVGTTNDRFSGPVGSVSFDPRNKDVIIFNNISAPFVTVIYITESSNVLGYDQFDLNAVDTVDDPLDYVYENFNNNNNNKAIVKPIRSLGVQAIVLFNNYKLTEDFPKYIFAKIMYLDLKNMNKEQYPLDLHTFLLGVYTLSYAGSKVVTNDTNGDDTNTELDFNVNFGRPTSSGQPYAIDVLTQQQKDSYILVGKSKFTSGQHDPNSLIFSYTNKINT